MVDFKAKHSERKASDPLPRRGVEPTSARDAWGETETVGGGGTMHDFRMGPLVGTLLSADIVSTQYGDRLVVSFRTADGVRDHFMSESWAGKFAGRVGQRGMVESNGESGTKVRYTLRWVAGSVPGASVVGRKAPKSREPGDDGDGPSW